MDDAIDDSDDEVDYSKMDAGNKKGPIGKFNLSSPITLQFLWNALGSIYSDQIKYHTSPNGKSYIFIQKQSGVIIFPRRNIFNKLKRLSL